MNELYVDAWEDHEEFTFNTSSNGVANTLPDGYYESVLLAQETQSGSGPLDEDYSSTFLVLAGDLDHSGAVDGDDYVIYDANVASQFPGYHNGDVNYDGAITIADWQIIEGNYGKVLLPPPTSPGTIQTIMDSESSIQIVWAERTDVDGYSIYRSSDGGINYTLIQLLEQPDAITWIDTGLEEGTRYHYRVRAFTASAGNSITSNASASVTNLPGPDQLSVTGVTSESLFLNWQDNSTNESGYEIWMQTGGVGGFQLIATVPGGAHGEFDTPVFEKNGLTPGTTYSFRVRAVTAAAESIFSPTLEIVAGAPLAPSGLWIGQFSSTELGLQWEDNADSETGFAIERSADGNTGWTTVATAEPNQHTYLDTGLAPDTSYFYRVRATNGLGPSAPSNIASNATTPNAPGAPSAPNVTAVTSHSITLSWSPDDAVGEWIIEKHDGFALMKTSPFGR